MLRVLAALLALIFTVAFALLLLMALGAADLASCSDPDAVPASGEDDCIEGSSAERLIGLVLGFGSVAAAAATVGFAFVYARRGQGGRRALASAVATPILALAALLLLPVSF